MVRKLLVGTLAVAVAAGLTSFYVLVPETVAAGATEEVLPSTTTTIVAPSVTKPNAAVEPVAVKVTVDVLSAQKRLDALGYWNGKADGKLGASTAQAVLAFQKVEHLTRTGKLDAATVERLAVAERPEPGYTGDLVVIDKSLQVIFVVQQGAVRYVFNTSTGTEKTYVENGVRGTAHTPTGDFSVLREVDRYDKGPLGSLYRPKYLTTNGIAVHGAAAIPAYPASHGCARVSNAVMDLIWSEGLLPLGQAVVIVA